MHLYPDADVPVVPLSMPLRLDAAGAWRIGEEAATASYVGEFVAWVRGALRDRTALLDWQARAPHARRAHPTPEHFLPLLVAAGAAGEVLDGGVSYGALSMESYVFG